MSSEQFSNSNNEQPQRFSSLPVWLLIVMVLVGGGIASFLLLRGIVWVVESIALYDIHTWEKGFQSYVRTFHEEPIRTIMLFFTYMGSFYATVFVALSFSILLMVHNMYREGLALLVTTAGAWQINVLLKSFFMRPRPDLEFWTHASGYSFPSGHSTIAAAMYGMLFVIWGMHRKRHQLSLTLPIVCGIVLIVGIGLSRVYLGVHYPTDIIGGYIAGSLWLSACAYSLYLWRQSDPQRTAIRY